LQYDTLRLDTGAKHDKVGHKGTSTPKETPKSSKSTNVNLDCST